MENLDWFKVGEKDILEVNQVTTVQAGLINICLTRTNDGYGALNNKCPHQGGPLGDGYIDLLSDGKCYVICPWHAYEYEAKTGSPPEGYDDAVETYPVEVREDGVYVGVKQPTHQSTLMNQVVNQMVDWGIDTVFGMVGHSNLGLADAFYSAHKNGKLRYIGIRHEGAGAFAASGYAKISGKPAACFSIAGPGAINLLTGLWDAKVDRVPILALTGQVNTQVLGPGAFQEVPLDKAFEAVSTWSHTVLKSENAVELMSLAIKNAIIKRDVSHLIFPDEVQGFPAIEEIKFSKKDQRISSPRIIPEPAIIEKIVSAINKSSRPAIIVGNGARDYTKEILDLAEKLDSPIITTFKAKGSVSDSHPLACGVLGRSGTPVSSTAMTRADLLIVLGASFSNHTSINQKKYTIQIDFDRMQLGKFHDIDLPVWGEISQVIDTILPQLTRKTNLEVRSMISRRWDRWREEKQKRAEIKSETGKIVNAKIMQVLTNTIPENAVITVDVGNNAYSLGMYFESKGQQFIMSGYLGSIGFAFPAAMGAWMAVGHERKIVAIAGDGGFGQYMAEFTTAVKYHMNITLILLNNSELAKISREQRSGNYHVWQTDLVNPNFSDFAKSCGGFGLRVDQASELEVAIKSALNYDGPSLVEIISDAGQL